METIILQGITPDELTQSIRKIIREELSSVQSPDTELKFYSREETSELLKISLPTLTEYVRRGLIKANRVGTRVLFSELDVQAALRTIPTEKRRR